MKTTDPDFALTNNFHYGLQDHLLIQTGVIDYEKDIDEFQQYEEEANPRVSRADVHSGRQAGPQQETGEGKEETGSVTPAGQGSVGQAPGKGRQGMENRTFGREERIRKKQDYSRIYEQGVRRHSERFTIITCPNQLGIRRLGLTVGRKAGKAVQRNRIKRLLREFFRLNKSRLPASHDIVIIAKRGILPLSRQEVCRELESRLIDRADV